MNPIILIPARMGSARLPGKPMADIHGRPMIVHVLEAARAAGIGPVAVACDDPAIEAAVRAAGGTAVTVAESLPSGTDRIERALAVLDPGGAHDAVVNLPGDLPAVPPAMLRAALGALAEPGADIATLVAPVVSADEAAAPAVVKCACAFPTGAATAPALYFSRQPIPGGEGPLWHHVDILAYRRAALSRLVALPPSPLEIREGLETLRALEAGMRIAAVRVDHAPFGVDTPADLARARAVLHPGLAANRNPTG